MKKKLFSLLLSLLAASAVSYGYTDFRGFNLDSLERVVAKWTPDAIERASEEELLALNRAYRDLMMGWQNLNGEKCAFYAWKALSISVPRKWEDASFDAYRFVGQVFYGAEQYDSAMFYYGKALEHLERMSPDAPGPDNPSAYTQSGIDNDRSLLYGTLGNLHNVMGDIPAAMDYYAKAGAIFDQYGWNESNTVLWYNIGETWMGEKEYRKAEAAYEKALRYAEASADSLMITYANKGLGRLYAEKGPMAKALKYLRDVNAYFVAHPDDSPVFRRENLEFIDKVLSRQKEQLALLLAASILLVILLIILLFVTRRLRKTRQEKEEATELIEEVLDEIPPQKDGVTLSQREKDILDLLSKGYTTLDIAQALCLSGETIRWYRKKVLAKFDASNTAELISMAKELRLV